MPIFWLANISCQAYKIKIKRKSREMFSNCLKMSKLAISSFKNKMIVAAICILRHISTAC
jgi:hypothetical protein